MLYAPPPLSAADEAVLEHVTGLWHRLRHQVREPQRWTGILRRVALARAIRGSNSIEGYVVTLDDAFAALDEEEPVTAGATAWAAVSGYRDAMTYVLQLADDEDFAYSEDLLRGLHFMMQSYDLSNRPGRYRKGDVYVVNDDRDEIVYTGPDSDHVPSLMMELVDGLHDRTPEPALVRAAMAHLNLVMVRPFKDGNGRMSRCLQALVLAREGVVVPEFCSIEEYLGRNERAYCDVLAAVGRGRWNPDGDAYPWVRLCLVAHYRQALTVLRRGKEADRLWLTAERETERHRLPGRLTAALFFAMSGRRLTNTTYRQLEDVSANVASRDLTDLARAGLVETVGEKRGRHYVPVDRLKQVSLDLRQELRQDHPADADPYHLAHPPHPT